MKATKLTPMHPPIIIKVGSAVLTDGSGQLDEQVIAHLVADMAMIHAKGQPVCLVSSGAIGAGLQVLSHHKKPKKLKQRQALAAVGQVRLMNLYQREFARFGIQIGQILLSHEDLAHRRSFLNTRATVMQLLELGVLPIINENDTVSTEEIEFGDNDRLAVLMANLVEADRGIFLTTAEGLLDMNRSGELIPTVKRIDAQILSMARGGNNMGRGGMASKLTSIDAMTRAGKDATLAHGKTPFILKRWFEGESVGTLFQAHKVKKSSRELWMRQNLKPLGRLIVDHGAKEALCQRHASLLSVGVLDVKGRFDAGQLVSVECEGKTFARGMTRYSSEQVKSVIGLSKEASSELLELKGKPCHLIHRNDFVIFEPEPV